MVERAALDRVIGVRVPVSQLIDKFDSDLTQIAMSLRNGCHIAELQEQCENR